MLGGVDVGGAGVLVDVDDGGTGVTVGSKEFMVKTFPEEMFSPSKVLNSTLYFPGMAFSEIVTVNLDSLARMKGTRMGLIDPLVNSTSETKSRLLPEMSTS